MFGRQNVAERRLDRPPAGERRAVHGLAWQAAQSATAREVAAALDLREVLLIGAPNVAPCTAASGHSATARRNACHAEQRPALAHMCTSGPGFFRYWLRIACADQNASAASVPVGL